MAYLGTRSSAHDEPRIHRWIWAGLGTLAAFSVLPAWPTFADTSQAQSAASIAQVEGNARSNSQPRQAQPAEAEAPANPGEVLHDRLFAALKAARNEAEGQAIENEIWRFWLADAPDSATRSLVDEAMKKRGVYDTEGAEALLDEAVAKSPAYAEAYNQRAFVRFLREDMDGALADADRALELEPKHFGAMAGRALILMRQGRFRLAQDQLHQAVAIHPFLKERSMIVPTDPAAGAPPAPEPSKPKGIDL